MSKELIIKNYRLSSDKVSLCVPVVGSTKESVIQQVKKCVSAGVPMIELRADYFDFLNDENDLLETLNLVSDLTGSTVVLFTIRTKIEGGEIEISDEKYESILLSVASSKAVDIVDVETSHLEDASHVVNQLHEAGAVVLASHHDFEKTPELLDMLDIYDDMLETGADILKLAVMPSDSEEVLRAMKACIVANEECEDVLIVMISMGKLGKISRVAGSLMGSCITFTTLGEASAPGQIDYSDMNTILKIIEE